MPSVEHLISFAVATFLFAVLPGPAMVAGLRRNGVAQRATRLVDGSVLIGLGARLAISRD